MWELDKNSSQPLYQQLVQLIIEKITKQEILAGEKLPSERKMASILQVNRSTITSAYQELEALNYVTREKGSGTRVNKITEATETVDWHRFFTRRSQVPYATFIEELSFFKEQQAVIDAYSGDLSSSSYPNYQLPHLTYNDFLIEENNQPQGLASLRNEIKHLVKETFSFEPYVDELLVTAGGQQSLFLIINALLKEKEVVVIEQPSYFYSMPIFKEKGIKTLEIPYTMDGFDWKLLEHIFNDNQVKLLFINPTYQNPTGKTLGLAQRKKLLALCKKYQVVIVEDDVFGLLGYPSQKSVPKLKKLSPESVIYLGSLTKVLGQTLKIGWIDAPKSVLKELMTVRTEWEQDVGTLPQVMVTQLLSQNTFQTTLEAFRLNLEQKMATFLFHLAHTFQQGEVVFEQPQGGYYLWLTFTNQALQVKQWQAFMREKRVLVLPSFLIEASTQSVRINVGRLAFSEMQQVCLFLKSLID